MLVQVAERANQRRLLAGDETPPRLYSHTAGPTTFTVCYRRRGGVPPTISTHLEPCTNGRTLCAAGTPVPRRFTTLTVSRSRMSAPRGTKHLSSGSRSVPSGCTGALLRPWTATDDSGDGLGDGAGHVLARILQHGAELGSAKEGGRPGPGPGSRGAACGRRWPGAARDA